MENPLTPEEKKRLQIDTPDDRVPSYLITKIIKKMKQENLIMEPRPLLSRSWTGLAASLLFGIGLFAVGYYAGKPEESKDSIAIATPKAAKFILLVHNDDLPAQDPMQQVREYSAWLQDIKAKRFAEGEHLHGNGWILSGIDQGRTEARSEFMGRQELGGYFTFEADNADEALAIAKTCPHLKYKGTLELREVYR